jgi:hypothetical protein
VLKDGQVLYYKTPRDLNPGRQRNRQRDRHRDRETEAETDRSLLAGRILCEQMTAIMPSPDTEEKSKTHIEQRQTEEGKER